MDKVFCLICKQRSSYRFFKSRCSTCSTLVWEKLGANDQCCIDVCRSFDQFANLVLEGAVERIIVGTLYAEDPLGLYVVRGENVVLLGDIDAAHDPPAILQKVLIPISALLLNTPAKDIWLMPLAGVGSPTFGEKLLSSYCSLQVSVAEIRQIQQDEKEQEKIKKTMKARMDFLEFD